MKDRIETKLETFISFILFTAFVTVAWLWLANPEPEGTIRIIIGF